MPSMSIANKELSVRFKHWEKFCSKLPKKLTKDNKFGLLQPTGKRFLPYKYYCSGCGERLETIEHECKFEEEYRNFTGRHIPDNYAKNVEEQSNNANEVTLEFNPEAFISWIFDLRKSLEENKELLNHALNENSELSDSLVKARKRISDLESQFLKDKESKTLIKISNEQAEAYKEYNSRQ